MAFSKTLAEKKLIIQCDCCFKEITLEPFVQCAECVWDLCLVCFSKNIQTSTHLNTHRYRLISNLEHPLFDPEWRILDELLLLNGIISFGIGNFEDIAHVFSSKSEKEVKKHFFELFSIENNEEGEIEFKEVPKSDPNDSYVLSYMSQRKDFESEILNDYEVLLNNLSFNSDDSEIDRRLKTHMLYNYKYILKQRSIWRNVVIDRNLVDVHKIRRNETGGVLSVISKYKWMVQYFSKNDINVFFKGLVREKKLKDQYYSLLSESTFIDESKINSVHVLLCEKENELCQKLKIPNLIYVKLKRLAIECYISKKPLKDFLYKLFAPEEENRISILYKWFCDQKIVHVNDF